MPTFADIREAHQRIRPYIHRTPVFSSAFISGQLGAEVVFKCENLQKAGAFKSRGACNAVFSLSDDEAGRGVITHSSGNHAAALARAAGLRGTIAYIVMPKNAPAVKVAAVRHYGGQITFCEPTQADREATAERIRQETGAVMVHPYNDERIIAGQGTAAVELLEDVPDLDVVITPVGGGGLLSGTAIAAKSIQPGIEVFGGGTRTVERCLPKFANRADCARDRGREFGRWAENQFGHADVSHPPRVGGWDSALRMRRPSPEPCGGCSSG